MAIQIQNIINEFAEKGRKIASCSITPCAHAILILKKSPINKSLSAQKMSLHFDERGEETYN